MLSGEGMRPNGCAFSSADVEDGAIDGGCAYDDVDMAAAGGYCQTEFGIFGTLCAVGKDVAMGCCTKKDTEGRTEATRLLSKPYLVRNS